jgi:hypothetical protein
VQGVASAQTPNVEAQIAGFLSAVGVPAEHWPEDGLPFVAAGDEGYEVVWVIH